MKSEPFAALAILHAALRHVARGRDYRALPELGSLTLHDRFAMGACIAPFSIYDSQGGDPLGDTYHYWAMAMAGFFGEVLGSVRGHSVHALFRAAPYLMSLIRGGPLDEIYSTEIIVRWTKWVFRMDAHWQKHSVADDRLSGAPVACSRAPRATAETRRRSCQALRVRHAGYRALTHA